MINTIVNAIGITATSPSIKQYTPRKCSLLCDWRGIPVGWATAGANRHEKILFGPTVEAVDCRGVIGDVEVLHLNRGYDRATVRQRCGEAELDEVICATRRAYGTAGVSAQNVPLERRWGSGRTNSCLSNFGQLRRSTDRTASQRLGQFALTITLIIVIKPFKWSDRWNRT